MSSKDVDESAMNVCGTCGSPKSRLLDQKDGLNKKEYLKRGERQTTMAACLRPTHRQI